jgi:2-polyprenyl-3-methyl-5-hydroxy-6-metoxy-1,4-benzoquinol methylase
MFDIKTLVEEIRPEDKTYFESSVPRYKRFLNLINNSADKEKTILDVGCSPGHLAIALSRMGYKVTGIDLNDEYLIKYNPLWLNEITRMKWDIEQNRLPFLDESFDYVIFTEILEHIAITHPKIIIEDLYRILKPKGFLYITTPNVACFTNIITLLRNRNIFWDTNIFYGSTDRHNREYTSLDLINMLGNANIKKYQLNYFSTWSNTKSAPVYIIKYLVDHNINNRLLDNTIEVICRK